VLPVASFAESQGTFVSSEGRAQRFFSVYKPLAERQSSWQWLLDLAPACGQQWDLENFDQVVEAIAHSRPVFEQLTDVAPNSQFRDRGSKIPRQTHRYSGRTAMNAGLSVHEPQQPIDAESPLSYSMEGLNRDQPASLTPYFWSPGWNSNQSLQKFQAEVDGPLKGGSAGVRLIQSTRRGAVRKAPQSHVELAPEKWLLVPRHRVHGSEELSVQTEEIAELAGVASIAIGPVDAKTLGVVAGDGLSLTQGGISLSLEVIVLQRVASHCAGYSVGYQQTLGLEAGMQVTLEKDGAWRRREPRLIATDKTIPSPLLTDRGSANA
jgi:NADH-quinone oxidoreductase subunit G